MEDKMVVGNEVMAQALQQEAELKKAALDVEEKKRLEQRMRDELEQQQDEKLNLEEKYASTEEQVEKMTAKLEKLWNRHKQTQQEVEDLQAEFQAEREEMLEAIRDLRKEVKLVCLTIDNFIPMEIHQQVVERAHYDESTDEWAISYIELAGNRVRRKGRILDDDGGGRDPSMARSGYNGSPDIAAQMNERPNVYFVYTEDGGAQRAETRTRSPVNNTKPQRQKSAGRPGTANRKGRAVKQGSVGGGGGFMHSQDPDDPMGSDAAFPRARGLVRAG
jgi:DNA repair exonuclease SbcCD ATPase subunit